MISSDGQFDLRNKVFLRQIKNSNQNKQEETCLAIALDNNKQIMASGCGKKIKLWNFKFGQIDEIAQLEEHKDLITCLIFSQKYRILISASQDFQLRLWRENNNFQWISSQAFQEHLGSINCCIMNQSESLLITGSDDQSIKIWATDFNQNQLFYQYPLNRHTKKVIGITLSPNDKVLASCGLDNQIIIWELAQYNRYEFKYVIKQSVIESGCRLCLISDNKLIWVSRSNEIMHVFEVQAGIFREQTELKLQLRHSPKCLEQFYFPISWIEKFKIFALKNRFNFYIIYEWHGQFVILSEIDLSSTATYGVVTNDGKYLIFWDEVSMSYSIFELIIQIL